jgi:hypothetical protein
MWTQTIFESFEENDEAKDRLATYVSTRIELILSSHRTLEVSQHHLNSDTYYLVQYNYEYTLYSTSTSSLRLV